MVHINFFKIIQPTVAFHSQMSLQPNVSNSPTSFGVPANVTAMGPDYAGRDTLGYRLKYGSGG